MVAAVDDEKLMVALAADVEALPVFGGVEAMV
jgi:hypothetical protein